MAEQDGENPALPQATAATIDQSPSTARLVVIGSGDFLNDTVFTISSQMSFDRYLNSIQLLQNAVDRSVEDLDLLSIRSRGATTRLLEPLEPNEESMWEALNYAVALMAIVVIGLIWASRRRNQKPMELHGSPPQKTEQEVSLEKV